MRAILWVGAILVASVTGTLLLENLYAQDAEPQSASEPMQTGLEPPASDDPAQHTVLESTLPAGIQPDSLFAQLIRMVQAGVDQEVMLAYISKSPRLFELDADDIIYLTDLGTPSEVIQAAINHDQKLIEEGVGNQSDDTPQAVVETVDEEPSEVTEDELYTTLSPYGSWVYLDGYGRCWRPTVVIHDSGWRPYCDNGRWVYTDHGWYWNSNYSWGWATFHYGRWFYDSHYGWCWWPDTVWAPSWVTWRYNNSYCGWAPLPPYTAYRSGVGIVYRNRAVSVGFDFNLNVTSFTFVSTRNFCDKNPRRHLVGRREAERIYRTTTGYHRMRGDRRGQSIVNEGIPVEHISDATKQDIRPVSLRDVRQRFQHTALAERLQTKRDASRERSSSRKDVKTAVRNRFLPADRKSKLVDKPSEQPDLGQGTNPVQEKRKPAREAIKNRVKQMPSAVSSSVEDAPKQRGPSKRETLRTQRKTKNTESQPRNQVRRWKPKAISPPAVKEWKQARRNKSDK